MAARAMEFDIIHFGSDSRRNFYAFVAKGFVARGQGANIQITPIQTHGTPLGFYYFNPEEIIITKYLLTASSQQVSRQMSSTATIV
jgi:hypothetical protein